MTKLKITKKNKTQTIEVDKFQIIEDSSPKIDKKVIKEYQKIYCWLPEPIEHKGLIFKVRQYHYDPFDDYAPVMDIDFVVSFKDKAFEKQLAAYKLTEDVYYLLKDSYGEWLSTKLEKQLNKKFKEFYNKNKKAFPPNTSFTDAIEIMEDAQ